MTKDLRRLRVRIFHPESFCCERNRRYQEFQRVELRIVSRLLLRLTADDYRQL